MCLILGPFLCMGFGLPARAESHATQKVMPHKDTGVLSRQGDSVELLRRL